MDKDSYITVGHTVGLNRITCIFVWININYKSFPKTFQNEYQMGKDGYIAVGGYCGFE